MWRFLWLMVLLGLMGMVNAQESANDNNNVLGINLNGVVDWSTEHPFADVFRTAREWISQKEGANWGEGGTLALTPEGWVASLSDGQFAETVLFSASPELNAVMDGQYTLLYEGDGDIAFRGNNVAVVSQESGKQVLDIKPSQGAVFLQITRTDPANPLRNIRLFMPNTDDSVRFNPLFLERIQAFKVLRFMDWMATNNSPIVEWEDRPQLSDAVWSINGVPLEIMLELANTLHADAWFTMPHQANDAYVRQFATLVRDQLNPELKVYIEYSNETWNGQFQQANYVIDQGLAANLGEGDSFWSGLQFHSQRAVAMFAIWEEVWGGTDRLVRVLASQAANAWTSEQVAVFNNAFQHADAIAIAPYFSCDDPANPATVDEISALSVDDLLDRQWANVQAGGCAYQWMVDQMAVAQQYGLQLVAYEGGQHLAGYGGTENNDTLTNLFIEANRHPRMTDIYLAYLQNWQALGGGMFVAFSDVGEYTKFGSWGVLETITQDPATAPKYQALLTFIENNQ